MTLISVCLYLKILWSCCHYKLAYLKGIIVRVADELQQRSHACRTVSYVDWSACVCSTTAGSMHTSGATQEYINRLSETAHSYGIILVRAYRCIFTCMPACPSGCVDLNMNFKCSNNNRISERCWVYVSHSIDCMD